MQLPAEFEQETRRLMGIERYEALRLALAKEPPVSIRLNPFKCSEWQVDDTLLEDCVPWCATGYYLHSRPAFTFDPLLHAGLYYVQEASSMFVDHVLRQYAKEPVTMLDLCAAPGGKSTCARAALPEGSLLFSNEPIASRSSILAENMQKFGHPDVIVTHNYPHEYRKSRLLFDIILCDVPCSGEGMFRKDGGAIAEWSLENVRRCRQLQREIVGDIWPCLRPGGLLIYSTCTFNVHENEENIEWIARELGAQTLAVDTPEEWHITGSLKEDFHEPVYRFLPGQTRGEGLFMAVLRKGGETPSRRDSRAAYSSRAAKSLRVVCDGVKPPIQKGRDLIPDISTALSIASDKDAYPRMELTYGQAVAYLRKEAIVLPMDSPRGIVMLTFQGIPLGFAKNIGNRANNLYPAEWKIKSTHIPEYETILRPA